MSDVLKLKEIELFRNVNDDILKYLASLLKEQSFKDGEAIFKEEDTGDEIYFISSGEVEIIKLINKQTGEYQSLSLLGKGEFFGEMAFIDQSKRSATAQAKGDVTLYKLRYHDFDRLLEKDAHIAVTILGGMLSTTSDRLRELDVGFVTIYKTGQIIATEQNIKKILDSVLVKIMEVITFAQEGFIGVWNEFSETFEVQSVAGLKEKELELKRDDVVIKWLEEHKKRLVINDSSVDPVFSKTSLPEYYGRSFISQPFIHRNKLLGFVVVSNSSRKEAFTRSQINLLSGIAGQVAPAIDNAKKITEENNRKRLESAKIRRGKRDWL